MAGQAASTVGPLAGHQEKPLCNIIQQALVWRRAAILFSVIISGAVWCVCYKSRQIHEQSHERTRQYLIDVTYQIHEHIETQIEKSLEMLRLIRNGALDIPQQDLTAYLGHQTEFSTFQRAVSGG